MFSKRTGSDAKYTSSPDDTPLAVETARVAAADRFGPASAEPRKPDEERVSLFWRLFGGTIVSVAALVSITLFNNLSSGIAEMRAEVSRLQEAKVEAAKKDDLNAIRTQVATFADYRREIDSLKERAAKNRDDLDAVKKETGGGVDAARRELVAQIELMRKEQATATDALKRELATVEVLKERLAVATAEFKAVKDELQKLRQDVDRNQAHDFERRDQRDVQMKAVNETLKELQKNLLEAREKIARLEGQQTTGKPAGGAESTAAKPPAPVKPRSNSSPRRATPVSGSGEGN